MDSDDSGLTLVDARRVYFERNGFGADGHYGEAWVRFRVGPFPVALPNTAGRVRAVRFHDLHHVVTGYPTTLAGEGQIGAWEIATGCANHPVALALNLTAMTVGAVIAPVRVFRAFVRGRRTRNLYRETFDDALLGRTVGDVKSALGLDGDPTGGTLTDTAVFAAWVLFGVFGGGAAIALASVPLGLALAVYAPDSSKA